MHDYSASALQATVQHAHSAQQEMTLQVTRLLLSEVDDSHFLSG